MRRDMDCKGITIIVNVSLSKPDGYVNEVTYRGGPDRPVEPASKIPLPEPGTTRYQTEEEAFDAGFSFGKAVIETL